MDKYPWEVGMEVAVNYPYGETVREIRPIERLTKTQVVLKDKLTKYNRESGMSIPYDGLNWSSIHPVTQKDWDTLEKRNLTQKLTNYRWREAPLDVLRRVVELLSEEANSGWVS